MQVNKIYLLVFLMASVLSTHAQSGSIDLSFGTGGKVVTDFGTYYDFGRSVAIQQDGKLVVGGTSSASFALARYNTDGTLDGGFGIGGIVTNTFLNETTNGSSITIQPDGKIILAGLVGSSVGNNFACARFDTTGNLDLSFGFNGWVTSNLGNSGADHANAMVLLSNGVILLAGESNIGVNSDFGLIAIGNSAFGTGGIVTTDFNGNNDVATAMTVQRDGKILVGGYTYSVLNNDDFALARYDTNGVLDNSFGINGRVIAGDTNINDGAFAIAAQQDGHILLAGYSTASDDISLLQFNSDGSIDSSFGSGGMVITNVLGIDASFGLALQKDGKILLCGESGNGANYRFVIARYNKDGTLDTSFSLDGIETTSFGTGVSVSGRSLLIQNDGKIVVAGHKVVSNVYDFALARYNSCYAYFTVSPDTIPHNWLLMDDSRGTPPFTYLWEWGDGTTSTSATPSHTYINPGYYAICLTITDSNNCVSTYCDSSNYLNRGDAGAAIITISVVPYTPVNVYEISHSPFNYIYPNPAADYLNIVGECTGPIKVYDMLGKKLMENYLQFTTPGIHHLDIAVLQPGVYILNTGLANYKFIKQ